MRKIISAMVIGFGLAFAAPAQAWFDFSTEVVTVTDLGSGNYSFSQAGWLGGASVTGTFSGMDDDNDGFLDAYYDEITDFSMNFSGNAHVGAFAFGFSNLFELVYELDGGPLGDGCDCSFEAIGAGNFNQFYLAGPGLFDVCGEGFECAVIATVPEPSNWALLIAGFGVVGAVLRRRRYLLA